MKAMRKYVVEIGAGIVQVFFVMTPVVLALYAIAFAYLGSWNDAALMAVALLAYALKSRMLRYEVAEHRSTRQHADQRVRETVEAEREACAQWLLRRAALYDKGADADAYIAKIEGRKPGDDPARDVETELLKGFAQDLRDMAAIIRSSEDDATDHQVRKASVHG